MKHKVSTGRFASVRYEGGRLYFLDQTLLPGEERYIEIDSAVAAWDAIKRLAIRGAPAIGVGAAYALVVSARDIASEDTEAFLTGLRMAKEYLESARPTAVNLHWALERMERRALACKEMLVEDIKAELEREAVAIHREDARMCRRIGEYGSALLREGMGVLTHCNAGALATSRYGTALAPIYLAREQGVRVKVFCDETRPLLQGSRLSAYELQRAGVDTTVITDNMAAAVMRRGWVDIVIVGADHVAANGDTANKIGTYGVALLARAHEIPFYVACPSSTISLDTPDGDAIPIEERDRLEVTGGWGRQTAPPDVKVYNPAFDVTPSRLITGFITEKGILRPPYGSSLRDAFGL